MCNDPNCYLYIVAVMNLVPVVEEVGADRVIRTD